MTKKSKRAPVEPDVEVKAHTVMRDALVACGVSTAAADAEYPLASVVVRAPAAIAADPRPPYDVDLTPIHAAAERAGLQVTSLSVSEHGLRVSCGPWVPPFEADDVPGIVAAIAAYNCKYCGTGGGHHPNCGRPR